ncbi:EAL domain-containing protein [Pontibacillus sp. HMF3514]|uniref:sensor domain-containing protein n=1 Tax=Pontibacillus sp. HMF3514 TaxID=2692425 RepID=UPI00131F8D65|nr:EAL domain-containing protein [Pontibacillus sp. HMF3514]QHE53662.1 EAL domain-containing protein [Pontibacillus sp. HMF3514]
MLFIFMMLFAIIPLVIGITIYFMLKKTKLASALLLFLGLASVWQFDVAILYAHEFFSYEVIDTVFRALRFGSIMLTPTLFYVAYLVVKEHLPQMKGTKWKRFMDIKVVWAFYAYSLFAYAMGWSHRGISGLKLMESDSFNSFYFPQYGSLSWVFTANVILFIFCTVVTCWLSLKIKKQGIGTFLTYFLFSTSVGYVIGILNMMPETRLFPSAIAVMVFALTILVLVTKIVNEKGEELEEKEAFLRSIIDINPNYIYATDKNGTLTLANKAFAELSGTTTDEIIGKRKEDTFDTLKTPLTEDDDCFFLQATKDTEEVITDVQGNKKWIHTDEIPFETTQGNLLLAVSTDITKIKQKEVEIIWQAFHDELTGLPNRRYFNEILQKEIEKAEGVHHEIAVMFLDLDRFKYINDTLSHEVGDALLKQVSVRLQQSSRNKKGKRAKVCRIGGDEFTFILPNSNGPEAVLFAKEIIASFEEVFTVYGHNLYITPSIGISLYPFDGVTANTLIKNADSAMYYVKDKGKNGFQIFNSDMNHDFYRKMVLEKELRQAIERDELSLHYQPQLNLESGRVVGMEALVRWDSQELGRVSPGEFIPLAEETGLILPVGEWILRRACRQNKEWIDQGYEPLRVAVNISQMQFMDPNFSNLVLQVLKETGLPAEYLELEITENIAMTDEQRVISVLSKLTKSGVKIAIDDFGKGYSSLGYLNKYSVDYLKIDKTFIQDLPYHPDNIAIVKSIISVAEHLEIELIAEGIENEKELQFVKELGCKYAQGYYIGHPTPANNFEVNVLGKIKQLEINRIT